MASLNCLETVMLHLYGGKNRRFTLYEDEGTNYNYEQGKYATIPFLYAILT